LLKEASSLCKLSSRTDLRTSMGNDRLHILLISGDIAQERPG